MDRRSDESELVGGPQLVAEEGGGVDDVVASLETRLGGVTARGGDLDAAGDALVGRLEVDAEGLVDRDEGLARSRASGHDAARRGGRGRLGPDARAGEGGAADRGEGVATLARAAIAIAIGDVSASDESERLTRLGCLGYPHRDTSSTSISLICILPRLYEEQLGKSFPVL